MKTAFTTLITCHANADCDAFAALIGASCLYPDAVLLFPGTQERLLHQFYTEYAFFMYPFINPKELDFSALRRLVLVDTRQSTRLKHVEALLNRADLETIVWDHHPADPDDVQAICHLEKIGSSASMIALELQKQGTPLPCEDATMLGLGIYADTGSFNYSSVTPQDFAAAAWLRQCGMDVEFITTLTETDVTSKHIRALHELLESAVTHSIRGIPVVIAEVSLENYLEEFSHVVQRMMEIEHCDVLFALGSMGDRVHIIARSRLPEVDVGQICSMLGGGGHAYAASVSLKDSPLPQVREDLFRLLYTHVGADRIAQNYMTAPAIGIEEETSMHNAEELMNRFGLKAVPVFRRNTRQCVGLLEQQTAARATPHGLSASPVSDYMRRKVHTVRPDTSLQEVMDTIVSDGQRLVPVVSRQEVVGVITRTDIINVFMEEPSRIPVNRETPNERDLIKFLRDKLPCPVFALLEKVGQIGMQLNMPVYVVGGFVRDLLLERPNIDIDLVVEGEGPAFAHALATEYHGRVREHQEFLTAVVIFEDKQQQEQRIDVATARLEYYEYPAALPTVELSCIKMDLFRRDFTINALAIRLDGQHFGKLVDFFGGRRDLRDKHIRVLHALSFVEDPTRILRAVRFEQRYGFKLGTQTERLVKNALGLELIEKISGARLFHELQLIANEENAGKCFIRLDGLGVLTAIHRLLRLKPATKTLLQNQETILDWYRLLYFEEKPQRWLVFLYGLCRHASYLEAAEIYTRFGLSKKRRDAVLAQREAIRTILPQLEQWQKNAGTVSALYIMLVPLELESLLYLMARVEDDTLQKTISHYLTTWRKEHIDFDGSDLKAAGLPPGPSYALIFRKVLAAKLDGHVSSREEQLKLAYSFIQQLLPEAKKWAESHEDAQTMRSAVQPDSCSSGTGSVES